MPGDPYKKILVRLTLDNQDFKKTLTEIRSALKEVNNQAKSDASKSIASAKEHIALTNQEIADQKRLAAEARALAEFDKAKVAWQKQQQEQLNTKIRTLALETAEAKKQQVLSQAAIRLEQDKLRLVQQQYRVQQQQTKEQEKLVKATGGGGILSSIAGTLGGGFVGKLATGVGVGSLLSESTIRLFESAKEKIHALTEAMIEASGPASQLREQFEKLSARAGISPDIYLNKLRVATRGLADDTSLYRIANNYMQQGIKVTNDQIVSLIGATVNLARAQGRDATTAIQALERASKTGRTQILAMVTGLTREELALRGIGMSMDAVSRNTLQFNQVLQAMEARLKAVGTPATTLPELMEQFRNVQKNFIDDLAISVTKSHGYRDAISGISKVLFDLEPVLSKVVEAMSHLTEMFEIVTPAARAFISTMFAFGESAKSIIHVADSMLRIINLFNKADQESVTWRKWVGSIALMFESLSMNMDAVAIKASALGDIVSALSERNFSQARKVYDDAKRDLLKSGAEHAKAASDIMLYMAGRKEEVTPAGSEAQPPNLLMDQRLAKQREQITLLTAKLQLEAVKQQISAEEQLNKTRYDSGLVSLIAYTQKAKAIRDEDLNATLDEIDKEKKAKIAQLESTRKVEIQGVQYEVKDKRDVANLEGIIKLESDLKIQAAHTKHMTEMVHLDQSMLANQETAYAGYVDVIKQVSLKGVQERSKITEQEFSQGRLSAEDYISQRRMLIQEEYEVTVDGLDKQLAAAKDNAAEVEKINRQKTMAEVDRLSKLTDLTVSAEDTRLKAEQTRFDSAKKYMDVQSKIASMSFGPDRLSTQVETTQALSKITGEYVEHLKKLPEYTQVGTEGWIKINQQIVQATEEQQQLNLQLIKMKDIAAPMGNLFGQLAGILDRFQKSTGAMAVADTLKNMQGSFESMSKFTEQMAQYPTGAHGFFGSLGTSFKSLFKGIVTTTQAPLTAQQIFDQGLVKSTDRVDDFSAAITKVTQELNKLRDAAKSESDKTRSGIEGMLVPSHQFGTDYTEEGLAYLHEGERIIPAGLNRLMINPGLAISAAAGGGGEVPLEKVDETGDVFNKISEKGKSFTTALGEFTSKLSTAAQGVMGFVQSITGAKTGGQGAVGGIMGGMQLGQMGGPIGMAIGGIAGGLMGGIFGAKEKQLQQDIHRIQDQMQAIVDSMHEGAITLTQAIQAMRQERLQAIQILSQDPKGGKGGGKGGKKGYNPSQAQAVINQIDAQISQLVDQQQQILSQLNKQVASLAAPQPFQQYLSSLDQIVTQYQTFMSAAAGSTQEMANAQTYLNEALQQYSVTLSQQLNQAQQQAIQDGLTLLNLEYQRQQIINQEAQQEYDILTQGVLTRQRTTAMTKGQQIGQIQYQANMQLQQIDEQIALQQYKVQTEQKIFDLSTTRIGLEYQLLAAQESQAGYQSQQTAALLQVFQGLQSSMASGNLQGAISALGSTPTGTGLLTTLMGELGLGGYVPTGVLTGVGGATNYLSQIPQQYQSIANFINNIDPNFLMNLWNAMQTPAGSGQRQSVLQEAQPYANDANTSGYDFNSFAQWIQSGGTITGTTATVPSGYTPTGPSGLGSAGFPQPTAPGWAPSSIPSTPASNQTPYNAVTNSMDSLNTNTLSASQSMQQLAQNINAVLQGINQGYSTASKGAGGIGKKYLHLSGFQTGGPVLSSGPIQAEAGEYVLTADQGSALGDLIHFVKNFTASGASGPVIASGGIADPTGGLGGVIHQRLGVEQSIHDMTMARTDMEMNVVSARSTLIQAESDFLDKLNNTLSVIHKAGIGGNLEGMFQQAFEQRGRYGSGSFRRQQF